MRQSFTSFTFSSTYVSSVIGRWHEFVLERSLRGMLKSGSKGCRLRMSDQLPSNEKAPCRTLSVPLVNRPSRLNSWRKCSSTIDGPVRQDSKINISLSNRNNASHLARSPAGCHVQCFASHKHMFEEENTQHLGDELLGAEEDDIVERGPELQTADSAPSSLTTQTRKGEIPSW